jgi:LPXTG-motif cell wall-anchored protein
VTQATTAPTTPVTGSPSAALIWLGLALIAFGLGLIRLSRDGRAS